MVVDTSALVAILQKEPERVPFLRSMLAADRRLLSAATVIEAGMVIEARRGADAGAELDLLIQTARVEIVPLDAEQAGEARRAWRRFGKGNHPAALNFGDCCVYALAKVTGEPILCKGSDFGSTDIAIVNSGQE